MNYDGCKQSGEEAFILGIIFLTGQESIEIIAITANCSRNFSLGWFSCELVYKMCPWKAESVSQMVESLLLPDL